MNIVNVMLRMKRTAYEEPTSYSKTPQVANTSLKGALLASETSVFAQQASNDEEEVAATFEYQLT